MDEENNNEEQQTTTEEQDNVTINKVTLWKTVAGILGFLLVVSVFTGGFGRSGGSTTGAAVIEAQPNQPTAANVPPPTADAPLVDMESLIEDDDIEGDENAPVTIVEWSDFECPFCERFYSQTLGRIREEYIETGKVKFVYRDFPLNFHPNAQKAAEAAECSGEQGKYYEMHDKLFEEGVSGGINSFKQFAVDIGIDTEEFNECLDSGKMASEVRKDMQDGTAIGIRGTPGFVINGQVVSGAQPFENFKQVIEGELAK